MKKPIVFLAGACAVLSLVAFQQKPKFDLKASIARGKDVYMAQCMSCHLEAGEGIEGVYPPLAKSDYLMADKKRSIDNIIHGLSGGITVNGKSYDGDMTAMDMTDEEVSDVLNYVRNSWGNKGPAVLPEEVRAAR